jgi:hypothetical protein
MFTKAECIKKVCTPFEVQPLEITRTWEFHKKIEIFKLYILQQADEGSVKEPSQHKADIGYEHVRKNRASTQFSSWMSSVPDG